MLRDYYISLPYDCAPNCRICLGMGCVAKNNSGGFDIKQKLLKARKKGYYSVSFPYSVLRLKEINEILNDARALKLKVGLNLDQCVALDLNLSNFDYVNMVFTGSDRFCQAALQSSELPTDTRYVLLPKTDSNIIEFIKSVPQNFINNLYFHFSPYEKGKNLLPTVAVGNQLKIIRETFPNLKVRSLPDREVWDPRINKNLSLEASIEPEIEFKLPGKPKVSVVIPTFQSAGLICNVLKHLMQQTLPRHEFEVILVDDGSSDNTRQLVSNFIAPEKGNVNFCYIHFPRVHSRFRGDGNFRAGITRNVGVEHARGELLVFLDSDIIVPPKYLANLESLHQCHDVVQSVRLHLKKKERVSTVCYANVDLKKDTFVLEPNYWGIFFNIDSWSNINLYWKYTCTYALSMKTSVFKEIGWFKKTFVYYGFEDTDLGYRLAKAGKKFYLDKTPTFHLESVQDRTEYKKSNFERHLLLSKTAKIFFLNCLDLEVFEHFKFFMGGETSFLDLFKRKPKKSTASKISLMADQNHEMLRHIEPKRQNIPETSLKN